MPALDILDKGLKEESGGTKKAKPDELIRGQR